jgi:hypothetical protein
MEQFSSTNKGCFSVNSSEAGGEILLPISAQTGFGKELLDHGTAIVGLEKGTVGSRQPLICIDLAAFIYVRTHSAPLEQIAGQTRTSFEQVCIRIPHVVSQGSLRNGHIPLSALPA